MRKTNLAQLLRGRPQGIFAAPFEQGEIGPDLFEAACRLSHGARGFGLEAP
jgi:bifunctional non-homologous end joining protein LigD